MAQRELNPILKLLLDLGPVVVYFGAYQYFQDRPVILGGREYGAVVLATASFMPLILVSTAITWALTRSLPRIAVFTALMVLVFGGMTVWLNDETFTKMRPTVVYGLFAAVLAFGLFAQGRSYIEYLMGQLMPMRPEGWRIFTRNWIIFFVAMSAFNEFVWRVLGEEAWIWLDTFGQFILTMGFIATQIPLMQRHGEPEDKTDG